MSRWLALSLLPLLVSCALPSEEDKHTSRVPPAAPTAASLAPIDMGELDDVEAPSEGAPIPAVMPTGLFATVEALCAAQEALIAPMLPAAQAELSERAVELKLAAHCEAAPEALEGVTVDLRAPFLDVIPVQIETGYATQIHLVVRIAGGWVAVPHASMDVFHDDPGCFSIERDTGLVAVSVIGDDAPSLELVEKSERGAMMDYDETGTRLAGTWSDVTERTVVCGVTPEGFACEDPVLLSVARVRTPL